MLEQLDVRAMRKPDKHPRIFEHLDTLAVGESFVLVNNHDPVHLRDEIEANHPGEFGWEPLQQGAEQQGAEQWKIRITRLTSTPLPRILGNTQELETSPLSPDASGAVWKLEMSRRHLDSNIIRLQPGARIEMHTGPDLDVLLHILYGGGQLTTAVSTLTLMPGALLWLPRLSRREIVAGEDGLTYFTVHPRRPGLTVQAAPHR